MNILSLLIWIIGTSPLWTIFWFPTLKMMQQHFSLAPKEWITLHHYWLSSVNFRISVEAFILTFRALHGQFEQNTSDLLEPHCSSRSLRSTGQKLLLVPYDPFTTCGNWALKTILCFFLFFFLVIFHVLLTICKPLNV